MLETTAWHLLPLLTKHDLSMQGREGVQFPQQCLMVDAVETTLDVGI